METNSEREMESVPCPVCFNASTRAARRDALTRDNFFMFCGRCKHGFCSKPAFTSRQNSAEKFNQNAFYGAEDAPMKTYYDPNETQSRRAARECCRVFQKFAPGKSLLEIGCGLGGFLRHAAGCSDFKLHGNDISPKACRHVRETLNIPVTDKAFTRELYLPQKFDMVYFNQVIEHIPDVHAFAREIRAVCNPGAIVGIVCPNHQSLVAGLKRKIFYTRWKMHEFGHLHWPMHLHGFSPSSLSRLMRDEGFETLRLGTWSKARRVYPVRLTLADKLLMPVHVAEFVLNRGNLIVGFYRATD